MIHLLPTSSSDGNLGYLKILLWSNSLYTHSLVYRTSQGLINTGTTARYSIKFKMYVQVSIIFIHFCRIQTLPVTRIETLSLQWNKEERVTPWSRNIALVLTVVFILTFVCCCVCRALVFSYTQAAAHTPLPVLSATL